MTTTVLPERLDVDDLTFTVEERPNRSTIEITVERDASLAIKVPTGASTDDVIGFVADKREWIYRKLAEKDALLGPTIAKQFVNGEGFAYLGRNHRLLLVDDQDADVRLDHGRFKMRTDRAIHGAVFMRRWYTDTGTTWLRRRAAPWAERMRVGGAEVRVLDLGYRWGSARDQHINMHWATLQLPPSIVDYVIVHELAHLDHPNHTPEFWTNVARSMPDFEERKTRLGLLGRTTWLGTS